MTTGRTTQKHERVYVNGYDLSGDARSIGPLGIAFAEVAMEGLADAIKGVLPGQGTITVGALNSLFNDSANAVHAVMNSAGVMRTVMVAMGIQAPPAAGDPVFCGQFEQKGYEAQLQGGGVISSIPFGTWSARAASTLYSIAWGRLLHAKAAETAVNAAAGIDDLAQTTLGGFMTYHLFTSNGTVTLKVQDSADNSLFADITGATSGAIDATTTPQSGIVALANNATVRRYLRWQLVFGTATTATFALAFSRD